MELSGVGSDRGGVALKRRLMDLILSGDLREITPVFDPDEGFTYCPPLRELGILDCEGLEEVLRGLTREGILRAELHDNIAVCGRCGSHRLVIRPVCPYCGSVNFRRTTVIEHLACGYSGPETDFKTPSGEMVCPKCGKRLRAIGVDYLRTADVYLCSDCGEFFSLPELKFVCADCGKENSAKDLRIVRVYSYRVVPERVRSLEEVSLLNELASRIRELGLLVEGPGARVRGVSGIEQGFTFVIKSPDEPIPLAVIDIVPTGRQLKEEDLLRFFAKAFDANARYWILAVPTGLDDRLRDVARRYGITLIESSGQGDLVEGVVRALRGMTSREKLLEEDHGYPG